MDTPCIDTMHTMDTPCIDAMGCLHAGEPVWEDLLMESVAKEMGGELLGFTTPVPKASERLEELWHECTARPVPEPIDPPLLALTEEDVTLLPLMFDETPAQEPECRIFGPGVGVRHKVFGMEPPTAQGHLRLVTREAGERVFYGKGVGVEEFVVDGIAGPPLEPGVVEKLAIVVHEINGAKPNEMPQTAVEPGQRFLSAQIRPTALPLAVKKRKEEKKEGTVPEPGINFWRGSEPNRFHVVIGEAKKGQGDKMDIGIKRTASWQFYYSQVHEASGAVRFEQIIPGTFIICAGCAAINEKNDRQEEARNGRKLAVIDLLNRAGLKAEAAGFRRRYRKRGLGEMLTCARDHGVSSAVLAKAIDDTEEYVHAQMKTEAARQKRRRL